MDIKIDLNGVQAGRRYVLDFCIREGDDNGQILSSSSVPIIEDKETAKKDDGMPSLEDIESENELKMPEIDNPPPKRKIKVERSWEGELDNA